MRRYQKLLPNPTVTVQAQGIEYSKPQSAMWLKSLIGLPVISCYDDDYFKAVGWCCGGLGWLSHWFRQEVSAKSNSAFNDSKLLTFAESLEKRFSQRAQFVFRDIVDEHPEILPFILKEVTAALEQSSRACLTQPPIIRDIQQFFGLDDPAC